MWDKCRDCGKLPVGVTSSGGHHTGSCPLPSRARARPLRRTGSPGPSCCNPPCCSPGKAPHHSTLLSGCDGSPPQQSEPGPCQGQAPPATSSDPALAALPHWAVLEPVQEGSGQVPALPSSCLRRPVSAVSAQMTVSGPSSQADRLALTLAPTAPRLSGLDTLSLATTQGSGVAAHHSHPGFS